MTAYQAERHLESLLPIESFRSLPVPTLRFGRPALVGVAGPKRKAGDEPVEPAYWFAVDLEADELLVFARTSMVSPIPGPPGPIPPVPGPAASYGASLAFLQESASSLRAAFFAGQPLAPGLAEQALSAYMSVIPARFLSWLCTCCSDFFDWLVLRP